MQIVDVDCSDAPFDGCATVAIIGNNNVWQLYQFLIAVSEGQLTPELRQFAGDVAKHLKNSQKLGSEIKMKVV